MALASVPRGRLGLLAVPLALLAFASPAAAQPGLNVVVDGQTRTVDAAALAASADVPPTTYTVGEQPAQLTGTSVRRAIGLAGADPGSVSAATAEGAGDTLLQLLMDELALSAFPEGPALVWIDDQQRTNLLRPVSAGGDPSKVVSSAPGEPLRLTLDGTTPLEVSVIANQERAEPGERVPLRAYASGTGLTYTWDFDDGTEATGKVVSHAFRAAGRYRVTVRASDGAGAGGTSEPVTIVVGKPKAARSGDEAGGGTGAAGGGGAGAGSAGGAGGGGSAGVGSAGGAGGGGGAGSGSGAGSQSGGGTGAGAGSGAPASPGSPAADPPPAQPPAPGAEAAPAKPTKPRARSRAAKRTARAAAPAPRDPGMVEGVLLADTADPATSPAIRSAIAAARTPSPDDGGIAVPTGVWVALGAATLVAAGGLAQRRRDRRI